MKNQPAKIYGVLGNPIHHSLSPVMHNAAFKAEGFNGVYVAFESSDPEGSIRGMRALGICGMSVTIPFKTAVMPYLDELDPLAEQIGAINTILNQGGHLKGYNTDGLGSMKALEKKIDLAGKRCVLVGAGGAARGIGFMAREKGMKLVVANRSADRGRALAAFLDCPFIPLERIQETETDVLIQSTPVGMFPHENASPVPDGMLRKEMVVMDAIYNPLETRLLKSARARGCTTISGLEMFIHQGAEQFRLWTGLNPPVDVMRAVVKNALEPK
ncbi:MAG: shikimate dehydrogenase [Deltaproteobacteria bacterium]|nr:shikimate dehydrogenase [Deltaproteobacteria bacterium]